MAGFALKHGFYRKLLSIVNVCTVADGKTDKKINNHLWSIEEKGQMMLEKKFFSEDVNLLFGLEKSEFLIC